MNTPVIASMASATIVYGNAVLSKDSKITGRLVIGTFAYMIGLSLIANADSDLASKFSVLVLLTICYLYLPSFTKKLGLA